MNETQQLMSEPPQLPPLYRGQKIQSGPYTTTVTDQMVAQREQENEDLYRAWAEQQSRRMAPDDEEDAYVGDFKEENVRRSFVRKIFCVLTLQLLFTTSVIAVFLFVDAARKFMIMHWYLWIIAMICFTISYCAISLSETARRKPPFNYIWLVKLTLAMSYLAAFSSVAYEIETIFMALGMTTLITLGVGLLATFSRFDLTMRTGLIMIIGLACIVSIFVMVIVLMFTYIKVFHLLISIIGMVLLSMVNIQKLFALNKVYSNGQGSEYYYVLQYLYFDVQTIMGGRRIELNPDEVVFATVQIYVDIVLLYQYVLMFMGFFHQQ